MASGSNSRDSKSNFDTMDKLSSSTLKRNPKMELCKTDLLKLLTYLEGELQAREIVIATLKAERVKQLLYQAKYGQFSLNDPFAALQRDSYGAYNPNCDEAAIKAMYNNQLSQVENLILQHRRAQQRLRQHLYDAEQQHGKVVTELEEEIRKHAQDTAQGDDVTYMLEKERERLHQEVELERQQNKKLERELKKVVQAMEQDKLRHKQIVMLLLEERKRIVAKLVDEHSKNEEMSQFLSMEKERMTDVVEGLEEESQKSLQMEADLEQQAAEFSREREQLRSCLRKEADKNRQLMEQIDLLKRELSDHPRHFSCPLQVGDGNTVHHSEAVLTVNVADDDATSDVDSNVDSDTALRTPPTVCEMTNMSVVAAAAAAAGVVVVNGNTAASAVALVPTNASHCTANPPAPPAKPTVLRTGSASASASAITTNSTTVCPTVPSLGESSPKMVPPRFLKSPVSSGSPSSGLTSPNSTTIVKLIHHGVTPSPTSSSTSPLLALASTQQTAQPENKQLVVQSVVVSTVSSPSPPSTAAAAAAAAATSPMPSPHVVHVSPRVSVSTSSGARVFTTTQGGKVTFHVTAPPPQPPKKPPQLAVVGGGGAGGAAAAAAAAATGVGRGAPPPVPPNKPILLKKGDVAASAAATTSTNKSPGSIKFGITISKGDGSGGSCVNSSSSAGGGGGGSSHIALSSLPVSVSTSGGPTVITATSVPTPPSHSSNATTSPIFKETQPVMVMACSPPPSSATSLMTARMTCRHVDNEDDDSLAPELADFQQLLVSMATSSSGAGYSSTVTSSTSMSNDGPTCSSTSPVGRLSAMLDGWKLDSDGDLDKCTRRTAAVGVTSKDKGRGGGGGGGGGSGVRNGNISGTGNRKVTNAFKPCVRKVVSPTLPKSFNHMDL